MRAPMSAQLPNGKVQRERTARAGCVVCYGDRAEWTAPNADGLAAIHSKRTGHATWCDIEIRYSGAAADSRQTDIEDAIASASSGDAPVCAPFPDLDAPAVTAADVSIPQGRPVETRRLKARAARGRKPEALHA